jgi:hypothetical protein
MTGVGTLLLPEETRRHSCTVGGAVVIAGAWSPTLPGIGCGSSDEEASAPETATEQESSDGQDILRAQADCFAGTGSTPSATATERGSPHTSACALGIP